MSSEGGPLRLESRLRFRVDQDGPSQRYEAVLEGYEHYLGDAETGREILAWHWHAESRHRHPHLHIGAAAARERLPALEKAHLPTGAVSLADVVACAVRDFGVVPLRRDWRQVLEEER